MKDIEQIRKQYDNGGYYYQITIADKLPTGYVYDEDKSVKENREFVEAHNNRITALKIKAREAQAKLNIQFHDDIIEYLMYNFGFNKQQAEHLEGFVWERKHSAMCDYFTYIRDVGFFAIELIDMGK